MTQQQQARYQSATERNFRNASDLVNLTNRYAGQTENREAFIERMADKDVGQIKHHLGIRLNDTSFDSGLADIQKACEAFTKKKRNAEKKRAAEAQATLEAMEKAMATSIRTPQFNAKKR